MRATEWSFSNNFKTLDEWLELLLSKNDKEIIPSNHMPSEEMLEEYLFTIHNRTDDEVKNLIRKFLIHSGNFGMDKSNLDIYNFCRKSNNDEHKVIFNDMSKSEYYRRLSEGEYAWEGITWILDLIPHHPQKAIYAINSYLFSHLSYLPDSAIYGLNDAMALIRAKFIEIKQPRALLLNLNPEQFEWLIEELYEKMGYRTELTPYHKDGGVDIIAEKDELGNKEKIFIQCKRYKNKIGVNAIRELRGVVIDQKVNKGVLICCSDFTRGAIKEKASLELIGYKELNKLLNAHLGTYWYALLDRIFINKEIREKSQN